MKSAINVLVGSSERGVLEHGEHAGVIDEHRSGRDELFSVPLQPSLDGAGGANERITGAVGELVAAGRGASDCAKSTEPAMADTGVHAVAELAGGADGGAVGLDVAAFDAEGRLTDKAPNTTP